MTAHEPIPTPCAACVAELLEGINAGDFRPAAYCAHNAVGVFLTILGGRVALWNLVGPLPFVEYQEALRMRFGAKALAAKGHLNG